MATVREHFDVDLKAMSIHNDWGVTDGAGSPKPPLTAKVFHDYFANAKYWSFFIPADVDYRGYVNAIFAKPETALCQLDANGDGVEVQMGLGDYSERASSLTLCFTKRVYLFIDQDLSADQRAQITLGALSLGYYAIVHDREYAAKRASFMKPMAFISHDSKDKDDLVRALAKELMGQMVPVWYDEFSLKVGDSLRASIERGLKEAHRCIVILSPAFLANGGWGKAEFDSIFTREILEQKNVILPVWHNVTKQEVYEYSPRLADKVALHSSMGVKELAGTLAGVIKSSAGLAS
jgi:hypothetical protein